MKKFVSVLLACVMTAALVTGCGSKESADTSADAPAAEEEAAEEAAPAEDGKVYSIGIVQQLEHPALDAATQGFQDACKELFGEGNITFDLQNGQGEQTNCATISNNFVASDVDLILANATTAL